MKFIRTHPYVFILSVCVFIYTLIRVFTLSAVNDECSLIWTNYDFKNTSIFDILSFRGLLCTANSHLINTLINHLACNLFGFKSLLFCRILNATLIIPYCVIGFKIANNVTNNSKYILLFFVILIFNLFLLDFFSLARGYAMATVFECWCIYYLIQFYKTHSYSYFFKCILTGVICGLANFSFVYFFLAAMSVLYFIAIYDYIIRTENRKLLYILLTGILLTLLVLMYMYPVSKQIIQCDPQYYGTNDGFFAGTLRSILAVLIYNLSLPPFFVVAGKAVFVILFASMIVYMLFIKKDFSEYIPLICLLICVVIIYIQHYAQHIKFPFERTAMYLIPLLLYMLIYFLNYMMQFKIKHLALVALLIFYACNTLPALNFKYTYTYNQCDNNQLLFQTLINDVCKEATNKPKKITIIDDISPVMYTYTGLKKYKNLTFSCISGYTTQQSFLTDSANYYVCSNYWNDKNMALIDKNFTVLFHSPKNKLMLLKNRKNI